MSRVYQVITMYGDNEPWWFFEEWKADIQEELTFVTLEEAQKFYQSKWRAICAEYEYIHAKPNYLCAFWNEEEERWCEECDEFLQQYVGLALLENYQPLKIESEREFYETTNSSGKAKRCQRSK